jgi:hypothetical protein
MPMPRPDFTPVMLTERFVDFLRFLESKGGKYQVRLPGLALETGNTMDQTRRIVRRARELRLIKVETGGSVAIGQPRQPNTYTLRVTADEWLVKRDEVAAKVLERQNEQTKIKREKTRRKKILDGHLERERAERVAKAKERTPTRAYPPPGMVIPKPTRDAVERNLADPDLDVDAWSGAEDF